LTAQVPNFRYIDPVYHQQQLDGQGIMDNQARQQAVNPFAEIYLKSSGSSGDTKVSGYSWADWRAQVEVVAESFFIGGVPPGDRCAMLYSAGNLYGGFIITLMALERLGATAITLGANTDVKTIVDNLRQPQPNVPLGMPS